jgi:hypothetical protein
MVRVSTPIRKVLISQKRTLDAIREYNHGGQFRAWTIRDDEYTALTSASTSLDFTPKDPPPPYCKIAYNGTSSNKSVCQGGRQDQKHFIGTGVRCINAELCSFEGGFRVYNLQPPMLSSPPQRQPSSHQRTYNFAPPEVRSFFAESLNSRLKIFPLGLFGITSK